MKKTILRTALLTLGATLVIAIAVFGIVSFCFPYVMMDFTASLGLESLSGDYAYQEYERSGSIDCLARSFVIAAERKNDKAADARFTVLYEEERDKFEEYCASFVADTAETGIEEVSMRDYLLGLACRVKYRLQNSSWDEVCDFAINNTKESFPQGNPVVYLAVEARGAGDASFCAKLLAKMQEKNFEKNSDYLRIEKLLGGTS